MLGLLHLLVHRRRSYICSWGLLPPAASGGNGSSALLACEGRPVWCPQGMTDAYSHSDQEAKALGMSWQINQRATALPNETTNCSTILIPAHLRSCSSKHSADLPFFLEQQCCSPPPCTSPRRTRGALTLGSPVNSAKWWGLYHRDTDLSKLSSPALIISAPWRHTPPCHCPTN